MRLSLLWDSMKLLSEDDRDGRPHLSILLTPGKYQATGTNRYVRLHRHNKPGGCAVSVLALQRAYLLDINYYAGALNFSHLTAHVYLT